MASWFRQEKGDNGTLNPDRDGVTVHARKTDPRPTLSSLIRSAFSKRSPLPDGVRVYAVGDVHGCLDLLLKAQQFILEDAQRANAQDNWVVYLGDYIDRGPDSKGVISSLLQPLAGLETVTLQGNHDAALLTFLETPGFYRNWRNFGADQTLASYNIEYQPSDHIDGFESLRDRFAAALPEEHLRFLRNLYYFARIGEYCFVHAGLRPGIPFAMQEKRDLLWIRDEFLTSDFDFGQIIVHGHTPVQMPIRRQNRIGIDTSCYATGILTLAVLSGSECNFIMVDDKGCRPSETVV